MTVKVGIVKLGNIGSAPLLEFLLDERADRKNINVRVFSSGAKLEKEDGEEIAKIAATQQCDLYITISPNAALPGPTTAREALHKTGKPLIVISDAPAKKLAKELPEDIGYIIVTVDPMIGARREVLDPTEMALFNGYLTVLLAAAGAFEAIRIAMDNTIASIEAGEQPVQLPNLVIGPKEGADALEFSNPYAYSMAYGALEIAKNIASINTNACFKVKDRKEYIPMIIAAHETLIMGVKMAEEARRIEKGVDAVFRTPHKKNITVYKRELMEKPKEREETAE